ncbi:MAG: YXWGXW repeat-containing protein [Nibricoccus sp.]
MKANLKSSPKTGLQCVLAGSAVALAFFAGCASEPESHMVSAPPPPPPTQTATTVTQPVTVTTPATSTSPATATPVIITQVPPAAQQEQITERPTANHVWIPGYWTWRDGRYVWIAGRWEIPPRADATWVAPRWERESSGYRFYEGYWQ